MLKNRENIISNVNVIGTHTFNGILTVDNLITDQTFMMRFHDIVIRVHNYRNFVSQSKRQIQHHVPALLLQF